MLSLQLQLMPSTSKLEISLQSRCTHEQPETGLKPMAAICGKLSVAVLAAGLLVMPGLLSEYHIHSVYHI